MGRNAKKRQADTLRDLFKRGKRSRERETAGERASASASESGGGRGEAATVSDTVSNSAEFTSRVRAAVQTANDRFYNEAEVATRYAPQGSARAFLESAASPTDESAAVQISASGADASVSRIDELISARDNQSAARRSHSLLRSGVRPDSVVGVLADTESVVTVDDFVRRVLALETVDGTTKDWYDRPYQVTGFASEEPNPRYEELRAARDALERRRVGLIAERGRINAMQRALGSEAIARDTERRLELARRQLALYQPPETVQLLKPASEVRALNERWRALLGNKLATVYLEYERTTDAALGTSAALDENARGLVLENYMQRVVAPVFDRYLAQLRTSTYEDMPLTRETLQNYFYQFLQLVVESMLDDEVRNGEEALAERRAAQEEAAGRNFAFGLDDAVRGAAATDERAVFVGYLRQALRLHAIADYEQWLERWITDVDASDPGVLTPALKDSLRRAVRNMIEARENDYRARTARANRAVSMHRAPTEASVLEAYGNLITDEVASVRADTIVDQEDEEALRANIQAVLAGRADRIDANVLVHPRLNQLEVLQEQRGQREAQLRDTYPNAAASSDDDDEAQFVGVQQERAALAAALETLNDRANSIESQFKQFVPYTNFSALGAHGPADAAQGGFSPLNLAYPLDVSKTRRQREPLASTVMRQMETFDAEAIHSRAEQMRSLLSFGYAEELTLREINRIDYALKHLAQPTRSAPLNVLRRVGSAQPPLLFDVGVALRDELQLALHDNTDERLDNAVRELRSSAFQLRLFFVPRYVPGTDRIDGAQSEVLLFTKRLSANEKRTTLRVPSDPTGVGLGGRYRVEAQRLDDDGELVGPVYKSRFTANVRIFARCARDRAEYEVGTEEFGECTWVAAPRDAELAELADQLRLRIQGGTALQANADVPRIPGRNAPTVAGLPRTAFLPPWGDENEQSLFLAAAQELSNGAISAQFTYTAIFERAAKRIGAVMRAAILSRPNLRDSLRELAKRQSNLDWVAVLTQPTAVQVDASGDPHEMQLLALYEATSYNHSDRDMVETSPFDFAKLYDQFVPLADSGRALQLEIENMGVFEPQRRMDALDESAVQPVSVYGKRSIAQIPIATLLYTFYAPAVWHLLAWYERRFLNIMFDRFETMAREYRLRERRRVDANRLPSTMRMVPLIATLDAGQGPRDFAFEKANQRTVLRDATERAIDQRLATMLPRRAAHASNDPENFLRDNALDADWQERLQGLARRGLLIECEVLARDEATRRVSRSTTYRLAAPSSGAVKFYNNADARGKWRGEHSYLSVQPEVYDIDIPILRRASLDAPASIVQRGSAPADKNFDFDALHGMIEARITRYNAVQRNVGMAAGSRRAALQTIGSELHDLELLHNFLALVAPPVSVGASFTADQLRHSFRDRPQLFRNLRAMLSLNRGTRV